MSKYGSAAIRGAAVLVAVVLLTGCGAKEPARTDAYYDDLVGAYMVHDDRSDEAIEAYRCAQGRWDLEAVIRSYISGSTTVLAGKNAHEVAQLLEDARPEAGLGWSDHYWDECPADGEYGVWYEQTISKSGATLRTVEIVCSIHTPEAYEEYLEAIDAGDE
jgi:hypothetical protein